MTDGAFCEDVYMRQLLNITTRLLATGSNSRRRDCHLTVTPPVYPY